MTASIITSIPSTFTNGQIADAGQVMGDLQAIQAQVNANGVDITSAQSIGGAKTWTGLNTFGAGISISSGGITVPTGGGATSVQSLISATGMTITAGGANITGAVSVAGATSFTNASGSTPVLVNPIGGALGVQIVDTTASAVAALYLQGGASGTPAKTIRSFNGQLQVVNSANTTTILALTDAGALTVTAGVSATTGSFSGAVSSSGFSGPLNGNVTGNVTGNVSGSSGSCTGNSATATALASGLATGGVGTCVGLLSPQTPNGAGFSGTWTAIGPSFVVGGGTFQNWQRVS